MKKLKWFFKFLAYNIKTQYVKQLRHFAVGAKAKGKNKKENLQRGNYLISFIEFINSYGIVRTQFPADDTDRVILTEIRFLRIPFYRSATWNHESSWSKF